MPLRCHILNKGAQHLSRIDSCNNRVHSFIAILLIHTFLRSRWAKCWHYRYIEYFITWLTKYQTEVFFVAFCKQNDSSKCNYRYKKYNLVQHLYYVSHGNNLLVITGLVLIYFIDHTSFSCHSIDFTGHHTFSVIDVMPMMHQFRI